MPIAFALWYCRFGIDLGVVIVSFVSEYLVAIQKFALFAKSVDSIEPKYFTYVWKHLFSYRNEFKIISRMI